MANGYYRDCKYSDEGEKIYLVASSANVSLQLGHGPLFLDVPFPTYQQLQAVIAFGPESVDRHLSSLSCPLTKEAYRPREITPHPLWHEFVADLPPHQIETLD